MIKDILPIAAMLFLAYMMIYFTRSAQQEVVLYKTKYYNAQRTIDSLQTENYPCQIELNRYKVAYEIFVKRNPKAASQYGDIISNETE